MKTTYGGFDVTSKTNTRCMKYTREDGEIFRATHHAADLTAVLDGGAGVYRADRARPGFSHTATVDLQVDSSELGGHFDTLWITAAEFAAGLWEGCQVDVWWVDSADTSKYMPVTRKYFGRLEWHEKGYRVELVSLSAKLSQRSGRVLSPMCEFDLGQAVVSNRGCGVDTDALKDAGTVESSAGRDRFVYTSGSSITQQIGATPGDPVADDGLKLGRVTWLTGDNAGLSMDVKGNTAASRTVRLLRPMPYDIAAADTFEVHVGCDGTVATCTLFSNILRFGGHPHVPTPEKLAARAGT